MEFLVDVVDGMTLVVVVEQKKFDERVEQPEIGGSLERVLVVDEPDGHHQMSRVVLVVFAHVLVPLLMVGPH
jgi:hypothetical protein